MLDKDRIRQLVAKLSGVASGGAIKGKLGDLQMTLAEVLADEARALLDKEFAALLGDVHDGVCPRCGVQQDELERLRRAASAYRQKAEDYLKFGRKHEAQANMLTDALKDAGYQVEAAHRLLAQQGVAETDETGRLSLPKRIKAFIVLVQQPVTTTSDRPVDEVLRDIEAKADAEADRATLDDEVADDNS